MSELKSEFLCEVTANIDKPMPLGQTPHGLRIIALITGGTLDGPKIKGEVLPGGGDWLIVRPDGATELDVRAAIRTDDGELIYIYYRGILSIDPKLMMKIQQGEEVDPGEYYFRTTPVFETASEKYGWLNKIISVGVGTFKPGQVSYKIYSIL